MAFRLSNGVHFCIANGQLTFLNVNTGRYLALSGPGGHAFRKLIAAAPLEKADINALMPLEASGILTSTAATIAALSPIAPSQAQSDVSDANHGLHPFLHPCLLASALAAQIRMRHDIRHQTLGQVLARTARRRNHPTRLGSKIDTRLAAAVFNSTRMLVTTQDQCLNWSLAMMHYLADLGIAATLILGVRRMPWSAHAWVQQDEVVLSDSVDSVIHYTPILMV